MLGAQLRRFGPEEQKELITRAPMLLRRREGGQERKSTAMLSMRAENAGPVGANERDGAERSQVEARARSLRPVLTHAAKLPAGPDDGNVNTLTTQRIEAARKNSEFGLRQDGAAADRKISSSIRLIPEQC